MAAPALALVQPRPQVEAVKPRNFDTIVRGPYLLAYDTHKGWPGASSRFVLRQLVNDTWRRWAYVTGREIGFTGGELNEQHLRAAVAVASKPRGTR